MFKSNSTDPFILIDAGHGGLKQNGTYATYPYKRHAFADTQINEGVLNRAVANLLSFKLDFHGIKNCLVANGSHDFSLDARSDFANDVHLNFNRCFFLSIHHNFFKDDRPKGAEFFTYDNLTPKSDAIAQYAGELFLQKFSTQRKLRIQGGYINNKKDLKLFKKANFHVLRETTMPAIVSEFGFMSNPEDYNYISSNQGISDQVDFWFEVISYAINTKLI